MSFGFIVCAIDIAFLLTALFPRLDGVALAGGLRAPEHFARAAINAAGQHHKREHQNEYLHGLSLR